jgi:hypothetical protein
MDTISAPQILEGRLYAMVQGNIRLEKSPHARMRSGAGQAGAFTGGVQLAGCRTVTPRSRAVNCKAMSGGHPYAETGARAAAGYAARVLPAGRKPAT